jgi:hypothetical protein
LRRGSAREFAHQRAVGGDACRERAVLVGVDLIEPGAEHRDRRAGRGQCALVGRSIDAVGEPTRDVSPARDGSSANFIAVRRAGSVGLREPTIASCGRVRLAGSPRTQSTAGAVLA